MGPAWKYVADECNCDEERAAKLLSINQDDPVKAVQHYKTLHAMLSRRGHSGIGHAPLRAPVGNRSPPRRGPIHQTAGAESDTMSTTRSVGVVEDESPGGQLPLPEADMCGNQSTLTDLADVTAITSAIAGVSTPLPATQIDAAPTDNGPRAWDFQLPQIAGKDNVDIIVAVADYGGAGEVHEQDFSLRDACAAIQQGATLHDTQRYLQNFRPDAVKRQINDDVEGIPPIFYVVEANDPALLRLWASYGADICAVHPASGTPLLAYAIGLSEQLEGRDTSPVVTALLSLGASPSCIPDCLYRPYNRDLCQDEVLRDVAGLDREPKKEWQWCQPLSVRSKLARTAHLTQRYYLDRAAKLPRPNIRRRQIAALRNANAILGIPYYLIGQTVAADHLLRKLMTHITSLSKKPLVLTFAGPSGHGKTELARKLGYLLDLSLHVVDCTIFNDERELFGPRAPYFGSERGSPLNNFIAEHNRQQCIVFLDEFEKTSRAIHQSLLMPFDNGEYQDRRSQTTVDCSRTIWILATNALDETILDFCSANPALSGDAVQNTSNDATTQQLAKTLSIELRSAFLNRFGAPVTGRVSGFVPFLPFSRGEQSVVVHKFLLELAERVAAPVRLQPGAQEQLLGNVQLRVRRDASVCKLLAEAEYSEELGARSLRKAVDDVQDELVEMYLDEDGEIEEGEGVAPTAFVVDVHADEVVVRKEQAGLAIGI